MLVRPSVVVAIAVLGASSAPALAQSRSKNLRIDECAAARDFIESKGVNTKGRSATQFQRAALGGWADELFGSPAMSCSEIRKKAKEMGFVSPADRVRLEVDRFVRTGAAGQSAEQPRTYATGVDPDEQARADAIMQELAPLLQGLYPDGDSSAEPTQMPTVFPSLEEAAAIDSASPAEQAVGQLFGPQSGDTYIAEPATTLAEAEYAYEVGLDYFVQGATDSGAVIEALAEAFAPSASSDATRPEAAYLYESPDSQTTPASLLDEMAEQVTLYADGLTSAADASIESGLGVVNNYGDLFSAVHQDPYGFAEASSELFGAMGRDLVTAVKSDAKGVLGEAGALAAQSGESIVTGAVEDYEAAWDEGGSAGLAGHFTWDLILLGAAKVAKQAAPRGVSKTAPKIPDTRTVKTPKLGTPDYPVTLDAKGRTLYGRIGSNETMLGLYDADGSLVRNYMDMASGHGANAFFMPEARWNALTPKQRLKANTDFLDAAIERGDRITLSHNPHFAGDGMFAEEIKHLQNRGYNSFILNNGVWQALRR